MSITKRPFITCYGFSFTPKLVPTVVTVIFLALLIALGFWQLQRAEYKRQLLTQYQNRLTAAPLTLAQLQGDINQWQYYPLQLTGSYDNQHSFLLDNKFYKHQVGYQVLTPFIPLPSQRAVMINRGWIPRGDRTKLPQIPDINGVKTIQGLIYLPRKIFVLTGAQEQSRWPQVSQAIELDPYSKKLNQSLYPFVVLLAPTVSDGFVRDWNPVAVLPHKNVGYAVQWFALAAALFIIFLVVNTRREKKHG